MNNTCNKCRGIIREGESSWDIDGGLCQECWEAYCSELWWRTGGGIHEPIEGVEDEKD